MTMYILEAMETERKANEMTGVTFNGSVTFNGPMFDIHDNEHVHIYGMPTDGKTEGGGRKVDIQAVARALERCKPFLWGKAALATVFCVCRDEYGLGNNATWFENQMEEMGISCPPGTLSNAVRNNPFMKYPVSRWEQNGARERVMVLVKEFRKSVEEMLAEEAAT